MTTSVVAGSSRSLAAQGGKRTRPPTLSLATSNKRPIATNTIIELETPLDDNKLHRFSPSPTTPAFSTPVYSPQIDSDLTSGSDDLTKDFAVVEQLRRSVQKNLRLRPIRVSTPPHSPTTNRPLSSSSTWSDYSQQRSASPSSSIYYTPISESTRSPPTSAHFIGNGAFESAIAEASHAPSQPVGPSSLADRLVASRRPLLIDTRQIGSYLMSRIKHSINMAIPSLILKRLRKSGGGFQGIDSLRHFITTEQGKNAWDELMQPSGIWDGDVIVYDEEMNERDRNNVQTTAWALLPVVSPLLAHGCADYLEGGILAANTHPDLRRFILSGETDRDQPSALPPVQNTLPQKLIKKGLGLSQLNTTSAANLKLLPELERSAGSSPLPMMIGSWNISDSTPSPPPSQSVFPRPPPPRRPSLSALRRIDTKSAERLNGAPALPKLQVRTVPLRSATLAAPPMNGIWPSSPCAHSPSHLTLIHSNHTPPSSARLNAHSPSSASSGDYLLPPSPLYARPSTPRTPNTPMPLPPSPHTARPDLDQPPTTEEPLPVFSISTILPNFLFLGPEITAEEHVEELQSLGVKRILNLAAECDDDHGLHLRQRFERYVRIPMRDTVEEENITRGVREVCEILDDASLHSSPTYVHCKAGKSRSVTAVMAYLIHANHWTLSRAYTFVLERRKGISPNIGFVSELMNFEEQELGGKSVGVVKPPAGAESDASEGSEGESGTRQGNYSVAVVGARRMAHARESLPPAFMASSDVLAQGVGDVGQETEIKDASGRYRHLRRAPVDENTLQPMRRELEDEEAGSIMLLDIMSPDPLQLPSNPSLPVIPNSLTLNDPPPPYPSRERRARTGRRTRRHTTAMGHSQPSSTGAEFDEGRITSIPAYAFPQDVNELGTGAIASETTPLLSNSTHSSSLNISPSGRPARLPRPRTISQSSTVLSGVSASPSLAQTMASAFRLEMDSDLDLDAEDELRTGEEAERGGEDRLGSEVGICRRRVSRGGPKARWRRYFRVVGRRAYWASLFHLLVLNFPYALIAWVFLFVFTLLGTTLLVALPLGAVLCFFDLLGARTLARGEVLLQTTFHGSLAYDLDYPLPPIFTRLRPRTPAEVEAGIGYRTERSFYRNTYAMHHDPKAMEAIKSLVQPFMGNVASNSVIDGMKLVVLGGTVETARRVSSSAWSSFVNSFFLTAHFSEEDYPYEWLMLWLSRRPEWQRSREFETTTSSSNQGSFGYRETDNSFGDDEDIDEDGAPGKTRMRVVFQPTSDTTHTLFYRGHWLRVRRGRKSNGYEMLSISVVARNNSILKQLVLQAKKEYEAEAVHRIQIYFADSYGSWRWTDSRHKRPMSSIVLNPGVKEMLVADTHDFLKSEKWYADRGIPFRRGYLLYGVPGSGKSSLIHAIAGELMLDIYVVSLSSSWINDSTLTTLMGRVPSRCIVLLEDLDAAFTRSLSRTDKKKDASNEKNTDSEDNGDSSSSSHSRSSRRKHKEQLSDVNTLSLSGLLNALDGVAAAEGRILFATTNHLERLDPALCRPGRMDVWVEFKNASKWQAEALFRNFFPSSDADVAAPMIEGELDGLDIPSPPSPASSTLSSLFSDALSGLSSPSIGSGTGSPSILSSSSSASRAGSRRSDSISTQTGIKNEAYLPPAVEEDIAACSHSAPPLSGARLAILAKQFADSIPDEEFSVAALQGYLLKNKSRPEKAASDAAAWVISEREMREKLKKEKEVKDKERKEKEEKEREEQEKKDKEAVEKVSEAIVAVVNDENAAPPASSESVSDPPADSSNADDTEDENAAPAGTVTPSDASIAWIQVTDSSNSH
ncbi:hypothetical protein EW146_g3496 [Bondarzewia mesenterica]|uniref:Uncharacterized protein n=1 Tax=Bondarzewia mesenterica TaxID=1095465 RepID=A0A4V3XFF1_9AGAM|nr:hypothetical protein EW146_g3496 [Bondarzewia mesenterica]